MRQRIHSKEYREQSQKSYEKNKNMFFSILFPAPIWLALRAVNLYAIK